MTKQEKMDQLMIQLDDNNNLRLILRMVFKDAISRLDDETLDKVFYTLNPPIPEEPVEE